MAKLRTMHGFVKLGGKKKLINKKAVIPETNETSVMSDNHWLLISSEP